MEKLLKQIMDFSSLINSNREDLIEFDGQIASPQALIDWFECACVDFDKIVDSAQKLMTSKTLQ